MAIPNYQDLMLPVLECAANGEITPKAVVDILAKKLGLTEAELSELLPSKRAPKFYNRVAWAKFYLQKAGLITSTKRGYVEITEQGKKVLAQKPTRIDNKFLEQFQDFIDFRSRKPVTDEGAKNQTEEITSNETPEERIDGAYQEIESAIKIDLLNKILSCSPQFFEQLIIDLLLAMGYGGSKKEAAERLGKSGDGGIDGVIKEDPLGLDIIYLQAKRYAKDNTIGRPEIQKFVGSLSGEGATKGVFVTTSSFSREAKEFPNKVQQRIILIDGDELTTLMLNYGIGVREVRALKIHRIDEDYFEEI